LESTAGNPTALPSNDSLFREAGVGLRSRSFAQKGIVGSGMKKEQSSEEFYSPEVSFLDESKEESDGINKPKSLQHDGGAKRARDDTVSYARWLRDDFLHELL
jgi:hypothetical protein